MPRSRLTPWVNGRFSEAATASSTEWQHSTVAAGASYAMAPGLIVGAFGATRSSNSSRRTSGGDLEGDGRTAGAYGLVAGTETRFDGAIAHTWLDYDATAGTAEGDFDAGRWMFLTRLSAITDTDAGPSPLDGSILAARNAGRLHGQPRHGASQEQLHERPRQRRSAGGLYDPAFGIDDAFTLRRHLRRLLLRHGGRRRAVSEVGIGDGWAARATGGLAFTSTGGWAFVLGAEAGNLGGEGPEFWTGRLGGSLNF